MEIWKWDLGGEPWLVVDDPASTQFSLQSSVLQMQAKTVCVEKEGEFCKACRNEEPCSCYNGAVCWDVRAPKEVDRIPCTSARVTRPMR